MVFKVLLQNFTAFKFAGGTRKRLFRYTLVSETADDTVNPQSWKPFTAVTFHNPQQGNFSATQSRPVSLWIQDGTGLLRLEVHGAEAP